MSLGILRRVEVQEVVQEGQRKQEDTSGSVGGSARRLEETGEIRVEVQEVVQEGQRKQEETSESVGGSARRLKETGRDEWKCRKQCKKVRGNRKRRVKVQEVVQKGLRKLEDTSGSVGGSAERLEETGRYEWKFRRQCKKVRGNRMRRVKEQEVVQEGQRKQEETSGSVGGNARRLEETGRDEWKCRRQCNKVRGNRKTRVEVQEVVQ